MKLQHNPLDHPVTQEGRRETGDLVRVETEIGYRRSACNGESSGNVACSLITWVVGN
jgi:hypothetical protein